MEEKQKEEDITVKGRIVRASIDMLIKVILLVAVVFVCKNVEYIKEIIKSL
jgi:hypothetical protein